MNRKLIFLTIALLVIASMTLSACAAAPAAPAPTTAPEVPAATAVPPTAVPPTDAPAPAQPVTLTIWHNWGPDDAKGPVIQSIFKDFMAANPDIIIKDEVYVDADIPLKVETASSAKQEPDLVFVQRVGSPLTWTDSGVALPVNDWVKNWGLQDQFLSVALSNFTNPDGKIQAFPLEGYTWPIWYNTKVLKTAGVEIPKTTDELIAAAKKLKAAGLKPVIASGADGMGQYLFTLIVQSTMTDKEAEQAMGQGDWTIPSAIKGVELFVQLRNAGVFVKGIEGLDYPSAETGFFAGDVAMCHYGAWAFGDVAKELLPDLQIGGLPLPADSPHKAPIYYSSFTAKGVWVTPNGAAKEDAVKKFIQFLYKPEMIARLVEQSGMTPPLKNVPVDATKLNPLFVQSLSLPNIAEVAETPDFYLPAKIQPLFFTISQEAFAPGTKAEKILADLTTMYQTNK